MKNYIQKGNVLQFTAGADYASGAVVVLGALVGFVEGKVLSGAIGEAAVEGVFSCDKVSAQAWTQGQRLYWDVSLAKFTTVQDTDTVFAGVAAEDAANPSATGKIKLQDDGAPQAATVAALAQTISGTYQQAEVQAISSKVDAILTALKNAGLMA